MLEVEVHTATLLADLGDDSKLKACKEQLRAHIKAGGAPPQGYGAQAAEPQAFVRPAPRSQVRTTMCSRETICASEILARSGKIGWFSSIGPILPRS